MRWKPFKLPEDNEEVDFVKLSGRLTLSLSSLIIGYIIVKQISIVCGACDPQCRSIHMCIPIIVQ